MSGFCAVCCAIFCASACASCNVCGCCAVAGVTPIRTLRMIPLHARFIGCTFLETGKRSHKKVQKSQNFVFVIFVPFCGYFPSMLVDQRTTPPAGSRTRLLN